MDVLMPQLGETVAEGKITKWFKSAGDAVKPGDNLFEIETDKVSMEVPSITAGVLTEIRVPAGEVAPVGAVVAVIGGRGRRCRCASRNCLLAKPEPAKVSPSLVPAKAGIQDPMALGPRLRGDERAIGEFRVLQARSVLRGAHAGAQLRPGEDGGRHDGDAAGATAAVEGGIDLGSIAPSGPHGRIVARDVEVALAKGGRAPMGAPSLHSGASAEQVKALYQGVPFEEVPLDGMRAPLRAAWSRRSRPFRISISPPMSTIEQLLKLREEANAGAPKGESGRERPTSFRSMTSSSRRWRSRCSGCRRRMRCGRGIGYCDSSIRISASRSRSKAGCLRR